MADIDLNTVPFVPSTDVALIDPGTGRPKTAMHDWMFASQQWMSVNVTNLKIKVNTLTDQTDKNSTTITQLGQALTDGTGAYGSYITSINTRAGNATANGQVYLAAKATPAGAAASYGWYLTSGSAFAGMEAIALSGGGSAIGFTANQFYFTDSGTAQPVFAYNGSAFVFQVPVVIQSGSTGERTVQTPANTKIYDAAGTLRVAIGVGI